MICSPLHGAGRAATKHNATQHTTDVQTQPMSKIATRQMKHSVCLLSFITKY
jgi:hypothetical protein